MPSEIVSVRPLRGLQLLGVSLLALSLAEAAHAQGPQGGVVARGAARIAAGAERTVIRQSTRRAVIDWRRFDVGRDHTVVFEQPGKSSATLNRVTTARPSLIEGAIRAPGTVVIQNGAGVVFTEGATIDTGGLVATSRSVDAARFQATGKLALGGSGAGGAVTNRGKITVGEAGLAALVGDRVENAGVIVARRGAVVLAGGTTGTLDLAGDGLLKLAGKGSVTSAGAIDGTTVLLTVGEAAGVDDGALGEDDAGAVLDDDGAGGANRAFDHAGPGGGDAVERGRGLARLVEDHRVSAAAVEAAPVDHRPAGALADDGAVGAGGDPRRAAGDDPALWPLGVGGLGERECQERDAEQLEAAGRAHAYYP